LPATEIERLSIPVDDVSVDAIAQCPAGPFACYVMAHGAGAGMQHPFMRDVADGLAMRRIATFRYQFPYMQRGSGRPDSPRVAQATVRAAYLRAAELFGGLALFAGGKSFGGRMTSQAEASDPLPGAKGIVFLGFPLQSPGKPAGQRANHLHDVGIPMLFIQGTRDKLAEIGAVKDLVESLGARVTLKSIADADHSFHVPVRSGRKDGDVMNEMLDAMTDWLKSTANPSKNEAGG
jgi:predicted alpha/beta-hydrolase family hydrolase